jgi:Domain of unknown function (DUF3597)
MSIFGSIMSKIFGDKAPSATQASMTPSLGGAAPAAATPGASAATPVVAQQAAPVGAAPAAPAAAAVALVDVEEILDDMEGDGDQELNWRVSIVDLMKLLKLDSSLTARKTLAKELAYTGDMGDSAKMNIWLHKQVMTKLAQNGGKVPSDLTH